MTTVSKAIRGTAALLVVATLSSAPSRGADEMGVDPYVIEIDVRPWIETLRSDDLFQIDPAIDSLGALGDHVIPALQAALEIEEAQARINIVEVLRDIRTPATVPALIEAAKDENEEVRRDAIEALGRLGDPRAQTTLENALNDPSDKVKRVALTACLSLCTSPAALRRLVEMSLDNRTAVSARTSLSRVAAVDSDARIQTRKLSDEIAVPVLNDTGSASRYNAAVLVAQTGNHAALPVLRQCIEQEKQPLAAVFCIQGLGTLGSDDAIAALAEVARGGDNRLRRPAACKALASLTNQSQNARDAYAHCASTRAQDSGKRPAGKN